MNQKLVEELKTANPFNSFKFEYKNQSLLNEYCSSSKMNSLIVIGFHTSHSVVAIWKIEESKSEFENPIVWVDSEGSPLSVIASSFKDFLSILPYGVEYVYDIISSYESIRLNPSRKDEFSKKYNLETNQLKLEENFSKNEKLKKFTSLLEQEFGTEIEPDPFSKVVQAINSFPNFEEWFFS